LDDLADLEDELAASVRDITMEITRDVRETVRNLRDELTWAVREAGRTGRGAGAGPGTDGTTRPAGARPYSADQAAADEAPGGTDARDARGRAEDAAPGEAQGATSEAQDATSEAQGATSEAQDATSEAKGA